MTLARCIGFLVSGAACVQAVDERGQLNPIRKVVSLLQGMQKKVEEEGAREAELFEKFDCYCKTGSGDLAASISAAEDKAPAVGGSIEAAEAKLAGAKAALKQAQTDRSAAKAAMAQATAIREREAGTFAGLKSDHEANIAAIAKAVDAISKGMAGSFLQTPAAQVLRNAVAKSSLVGSDQEQLVAFLAQGSAYAPQSGEILGILKEMGDTMAASLSDATSTEKASITTYDGLIAAKSKEIEVLIASIESKTRQIGELGVSIVQMKEDLSETQQTLAQDRKFLAELEKSCASKAAEWQERSKTRSEELVALADTIKVLNDDDALELFKKTLPSGSASLIQVEHGVSAVHARAIAFLQSAKNVAPLSERPGLGMVMMALSSRSRSTGGFGAVIKMIDDLVKLLGQEQVDDDDKKEYCGLQFDSAEDKKKALEQAVAGEGSSIASAKDSIAALTKEIAALEAGIRALDVSVAGATAQRKDENAEYKALVTSDTAAQEVLAFAKNRLNKFYNPKLYKAPPPVELTAEDRIYSNQGGELVTAAPGGIAGTGITAFAQVSLHFQLKAPPAAPPSTWGAYATKTEENNGVIAMIDLLIKDLQKELTEAETQEKDSQAEYEQLMEDSADKRAIDSKALTQKGAAKADMDASLQAHLQARKEGANEVMLTAKYISSLHGDCDFLLQYFDARKTARADEVDSLTKAKAVLSGADYSLLQSTKAHGFLRGQ